MKDTVKELLKDKKMVAILVLGIFLIIFFLVKLLNSNSDVTEEIVNNEVNSGVADVIPFEKQKEEELNKTSNLRNVRNKNKNLNIDDNVGNAFVFSKEEEDSINEADSKIETDIKSQTSKLREQYKRQTNYNVYEDFNQNKTNNLPRVNNTPQQVVVKKEVIQVEEEQKKRRKDLNFTSGNLNGGNNTSSQNSNTVKAYIYNNGRKVKNNSSIKIMLNEPLTVNNVIIPKNEILTGIVGFEHERVTITVSSINYGGTIHKTNLIGYDVDGQKGIYNENVISHKVAEDNINSAIESGNSKVNIPLLGEVSIDLAKSKLKEQQVLVSDGTIIKLKNR